MFFFLSFFLSYSATKSFLIMKEKSNCTISASGRLKPGESTGGCEASRTNEVSCSVWKAEAGPGEWECRQRELPSSEKPVCALSLQLSLQQADTANLYAFFMTCVAWQALSPQLSLCLGSHLCRKRTHTCPHTNTIEHAPSHPSLSLSLSLSLD